MRNTTPSVGQEAARIFEFFCSRGARPFDTDVLQPATSLLDLYGEDIRSRAFVTEGAMRDELMLRPDFTVPLAKFHMESASESAGYAYSGQVFRVQRPGSGRPCEFPQVGFELFGGDDPAQADAEIFSAFCEILKPCDLSIATGDLRLLTTAVEGLAATEGQKAALKRHLWRPERFRQLLEKFSEKPDDGRQKEQLESEIEQNCRAAGIVIGQRRLSEVVENVLSQIHENRAPALPVEQLDSLDQLLDVKGDMQDSLLRLRQVAMDFPGIEKALDGIEQRMDALSRRGVAADDLRFEASFGRTRMEYYDGFVFGFFQGGEEQPVALGGRFDFLTEALGKGRTCPAVGGMIRPDLTLQCRQEAG
ncbi:MAG: ATP phosphoribosyltransferase regulatory subunit [Rhodobacteraceae bacterium]|nr:ATP phosphoribosyltransferase regulatory subunit [Paracoccaceae bacterium]MCY4195545.1 ATP phosphoribosyltransferase regulatory subunit [Paracoccaceae bacterium]